MATPKIIRGLSEQGAKQFPEIARRVLGKGQSTAVTPYAGGGRQVWFVEDFNVDDGTNVSRRNYSGKLYDTPDAATPISAAVVLARNTAEARNTSTVRAGLTVSPSSTTCGTVTGIEPARKIAHRVIGRQEIAGVSYFLFTYPNDPTIRR